MIAQPDGASRAKRRGVGDLVKGGTPIVGLTAYTAPIATLLDPHVDFLLVGDSVGMVVYGFESTLPVTVDMMIAHGAAVMRSSSRAPRQDWSLLAPVLFLEYQAPLRREVANEISRVLR